MTGLKCEILKSKHRYIFLTALAVTAMCIVWGTNGNYTEDIMRLGWRLFLYQMPLVNAIFFPVLASVVASSICSVEHKGHMLKSLCCIEERGKLYDAKLMYGLGIMTVCVLISWTATVLFGFYKGFGGEFPLELYLLYLLFTYVPTVVIFIFQYVISLLIKNQAAAFFTGVIGEFIGIFSMFLPSVPWLRRTVLWGYYGVLQFVGLFGWTKETKYKFAHLDLMTIDWPFFAVLIAVGIGLYLLGKYLFSRKEL